jgi:hypothetical protein
MLQTPSNAVVPSTIYTNGSFQLHVQAGGRYTCRIPQEALDDACLSSQPSADVFVDKIEARMLLMEARQGQLQTENQDLKTELNNTKLELSTTKSKLETFTGTVSVVPQC